jgi:hypothetical protein
MTTLDPSRLPPHFLTPPDQGGLDPNSREIEQIKQRALRRAEQLSNHLSGRGRQRRRPEPHGARAKTCRSIHHPARRPAQYRLGIRLDVRNLH